MPLYDYRCNACGHVFEKQLSMCDNDLPEREECPACIKKGSVVQFISSAPSFGDPYSLYQHSKMPQDWRNYLSDMKKNNPGSNINV